MKSTVISTNPPDIRRDISNLTFCEVSGKKDPTWIIRDEIGIIRLVPIYQSIWWHTNGCPENVDIVGGSASSRYHYALMATVGDQHMPPCLDLASLSKTINQSSEGS